MDTLLYANLDRGLVSATASVTPFTWPGLVQGDDVRVQLRFTRTLAAGTIEVRPEVEGVKLSIGKVDARPVAGTWKLRLGPEGVTGELDFDAAAGDIEAALNGVEWSGGTATVREVSGGVVLTFANVAADDDAVNLTLGESALEPQCFLSVRTYPLGGRLAHEIRLVQAPVAFTSTFARIVPAAPVISEIQAGGEADGVTWNEVQKLYVDPGFLGTYQIRWDYRRTIPLTTADGAEEIAAALNAIAKDGEAWAVGNPDQNTAYIEFTGDDFVGQDLALLEVFVVDAPEGDVTLTLPLNTPGVNALLRGGDSTEALVELEVTISEDEASRTYTVCRDTVTIRREINRPELEELTPINWVRPPGPRDYGAYDWSQVVTGDATIFTPMGNGSAREFEVTHGFGPAVRVDVLETSGDRILIHGTDYTATRTGTTVTVTLADAEATPAAGALTVLVTGYSERTAYAPHTHPIEGVTGLDAALEAFAARISDLEDLVPSGTLTARVTATDEAVARWELPGVSSVYPSLEAIPVTGSLLELDLTEIRAGGLMPAVSTGASILTLPTPLPTAGSAHAGKIYENQTEGPVRLPGGAGRGAYVLPPEGLASVFWDAARGRGFWYPVTRFGTEKTYYPVQFEVTLFEFSVLAEQFRAKRRFSIDLGIEAAILNATSRAQWVLVLEYGKPWQQTVPSVQGPNLSTITWNTLSPALNQRMLLSPIPTIHRIGLTIDRAADGTMAAVKRLYGDETSTTVPESAEFVVRGRLTRFDPGDEANPVGLVAMRGLNIGTDGKVDANLGVATIR
jgi:hypothetical protein